MELPINLLNLLTTQAINLAPSRQILIIFRLFLWYQKERFKQSVIVMGFHGGYWGYCILGIEFAFW